MKRFRPRVCFAVALSILGAALLSGCKSEPLGGEQPKTEVFVLVDLSQTWHDPADAQKEKINANLLTEIGEGISLAAENAEPPVMVQYRVIGQNSLDRPPICNVTYMPVLVGSRSRDPNRITRMRKLREYLGVDCPRVLLAGAAELSTEISAAVASVALRPVAPKAKRYVIIASDFREESQAHEPIRPRALDGTKVLVLFRPVGQDDHRTGGEMQARVGSWRSSLAQFGAQTSAVPDSGFSRTDVVHFLSDN